MNLLNRVLIDLQHQQPDLLDKLKLNHLGVYAVPDAKKVLDLTDHHRWTKWLLLGVTGLAMVGLGQFLAMESLKGSSQEQSTWSLLTKKKQNDKISVTDMGSPPGMIDKNLEEPTRTVAESTKAVNPEKPGVAWQKNAIKAMPEVASAGPAQDVVAPKKNRVSSNHQPKQLLSLPAPLTEFSMAGSQKAEPPKEMVIKIRNPGSLVPGGGNIDEIAQRGEQLLRSGDQAGAWQILQQVQQLDPNHLATLVLGAKLAIHQKRLMDAIRLLEKGVTLDDQRNDLIGMLALLLQKQGRYGLAENWYRMLVQREKRYAPWWLGLAISQDNLDRKSEALQAYQTAMEIGQFELSVMNYIKDRIQVLRQPVD